MPPDPNVTRLSHQYALAGLLNLYHFKTSHAHNCNKIAPSKYSFHSSNV